MHDIAGVRVLWCGRHSYGQAMVESLRGVLTIHKLNAIVIEQDLRAAIWEAVQ